MRALTTASVRAARSLVHRRVVARRIAPTRIEPKVERVAHAVGVARAVASLGLAVGRERPRIAMRPQPLRPALGRTPGGGNGERGR